MSTATAAQPSRPASTATGRTATVAGPTRGLVEITKVRKSFGATEVLKGITLTVEPGGVAVIVGPSGSGKSTLLRTINHLEKSTAATSPSTGRWWATRSGASGCTSCARRTS